MLAADEAELSRSEVAASGVGETVLLASGVGTAVAEEGVVPGSLWLVVVNAVPSSE